MVAIMQFWMGGYWFASPIGQTGLPLDVFGNPITVGAKVHLDMVVTSINTLDAHFGAIQCTFQYPGGKKLSPIQTGAFDPTQLVVSNLV